MKKLLTLFLALAMAFSLVACKSKEKTITVQVYGPDEKDPDVFKISQKAETIKDVLDSISSSGVFEYEYAKLSDGIVIMSVKGIMGDYTREGSYWEVTRNGSTIEGGIDKEKVDDGDVIELKYVKAEEPAIETVDGGWALFDKYNVVLNEKEKEVFEKATADMLSVSYEPIRIIATQVVNGTNYAYLVAQSKVTANPVKEFYIVKIYEDLDGNVDFKAINKLDPNAAITAEEMQTGAGAWSVADPDNSGIMLDEKAQASFSKAAETYVGVNLQPIQLLATQVVAGMNYIALCKGQSVTEKPVNAIYVVEWYANPEGGSEITSVKMLDLAYYTAGE